MIDPTEFESIVRFLVLAVGFYMAWNIGANDVSNAMGTSVGSGALTLKRAVLLAAVLEFCGAYFVGGEVSETVQHGLINQALFSYHPRILILGMCSALLGTSIWLQIASYFGWPVSTTHAIVGSIIGFGLIIGGSAAVEWGQISSIALSWVLSPVLSGCVSFLIFSLVQKKVLFAMNPVQASKKIIPFFFFIILFTFTLSLVGTDIKGTNAHPSLFPALLKAFIVGSLAALAGYILVHKFKQSKEPSSCSLYAPQSVVGLSKAVKHLQRVYCSCPEEAKSQIGSLLSQAKELSEKVRQETFFDEQSSEFVIVEKMFMYLQILSACYVAFAHGANDVANAIGPVAAVLAALNTGSLTNTAQVPSWLLALGGAGIILGLATWGWRVIETVGKKITELTPSRGFCAEFGAAATILLASKCGLPISTTHCLVGSILGVGLARGLSALNLSTLRDIILSWIITIPASASMAMLSFYFLKMALLP